jgi:UDPglucose 6-dehydrogenase
MNWARPNFNTYETVELSKFASNYFHASIISLWNELFILGKSIDVDIDWISKVILDVPGLESIYRVHGKAWGGLCLPKDTRELLGYANCKGVEMPILESVININEVMKRRFGVQSKHWKQLHPDWPKVS